MDGDWTIETAAAQLRPRGDMGSTEFRACLYLLDWSQRGIAAVLQVDEGTVRQWGREKRPIPPAVAVWLRRLAAVHAKYPPPVDPVLRRGPGAGNRPPAPGPGGAD